MFYNFAGAWEMFNTFVCFICLFVSLLLPSSSATPLHVLMLILLSKKETIDTLLYKQLSLWIEAGLANFFLKIIIFCQKSENFCRMKKKTTFALTSQLTCERNV